MKIGLDEEFILKTGCGCHLHLLGVRADGYSTVKRGGKQLGAHRVAWEQAYGPIPEGLWVLHRCDVRNCVNPQHLFLGTAKDNAADRQAKGRSAPVSDGFRFSAKGVPKSDEFKRQLAKRNSERVVSEETREKHRINAINYWTKRKSQ